MTGTLRQMLTCHWTARRMQRYLDADPAAPLTPREVARLEQHLAICEKCTQVVAEHRALHRALSMWSGGMPVDPGSVARMRTFLVELTESENR